MTDDDEERKRERVADVIFGDAADSTPADDDDERVRTLVARRLDKREADLEQLLFELLPEGAFDAYQRLEHGLLGDSLSDVVRYVLIKFVHDFSGRLEHLAPRITIDDQVLEAGARLVAELESMPPGQGSANAAEALRDLKAGLEGKLDESA